MTEAEKLIATEAALNFVVTQRNANANDAVQMAGEIAVLKATIAERDQQIIELTEGKKKK